MIVRDENTSTDALAIVEKYEAFVTYLYPILQRAPRQHGVNFLGYRIWHDHKLLRRDSVIRARRKIKAYRAGGEDERLRKFLAAWLGHARFADSGNLLRALGVVR